MGGTIGVESTPGVGSRFWFEIPATRAEAPAYVSPDHAAEQAARPLRILVVEDNAINRDVARKFLQKLRQDIETANDGAEGVARALAKPFDLILMDMQMPVMDGIAAAKALRAAGNVTPIVALTANASDRDRALCAEAGMNGFEAKPVSMRRLSALLKNYSSGVVADPGKATANARETDQLRDEGRVRDLVDALGEEGLKDLTSSFLSDGPSLLSELSAALEGNDAARLDRALHSIKGASSNLGFMRLALLAERLRHQPPDKEMVKVISNELALIDSSLSTKAA